MADMEIKMDETNNSGSSTRLFTQEEVNKIVRERLARERQKSQVEEQPEEQPENTEETALSEIDNDKNNNNDGKSDIIKTDNFYPEHDMLDNPSDVAKFREIFGSEHEADARDIRAFKEWKAYAETFGTEIKPVDEIELARWRAYTMDKAILDADATVIKKDGVSHIVQRGTKVAVVSNTPDNIMRTLFGLPPKKGL